MKEIKDQLKQKPYNNEFSVISDKPVFSIIVPIYNAEDNLEECIKSILCQSFGKERIQLILVNDGSTDSSKKICELYASDNPEIIVYVEQENSGVSAARNKGLELSRGTYIGFVDADDVISSDTLDKVHRFFLNCSQKVEVVVVPVFNMGAKETPHYLNGKFNNGTRVISLNRPVWNYVSTRVAQAFFIGDVARSHKFDEDITYFEDTKYVNEILSRTMLLGVVCGAKYFYRRFEKDCNKQNISLTHSAEERREFYIDTPRDVSLAILANNKSDDGCVLKYFQFVALCEMRWRTFYNCAEESNVLDPDDLIEYKKLCKEILSYIEDETIIECDLFNGWQKTYLLSVKHSKNIREELKYDETGELLWKRHALFDAVKQFRIDLVNMSVFNAVAVIRAVVIGYITNDVRIYANINGQRIEMLTLVECARTSKYDVMDKSFEYKRHIYEARVELKESISKIKFEYEIKDRIYKINKIGISSVEDIDSLRPVLRKENGFYIRRFKDHISFYRSSPINATKVFLSMGKRHVRNTWRKAVMAIRG